MKDYNKNATVMFSTNDSSEVVGKVKDFKDVEEFKRYLIGEEIVDPVNKKEFFEQEIEIIYLRFLPKGDKDYPGEAYYKKFKNPQGFSKQGATAYYLFRF